MEKNISKKELNSAKKLIENILNDPTNEQSRVVKLINEFVTKQNYIHIQLNSTSTFFGILLRHLNKERVYLPDGFYAFEAYVKMLTEVGNSLFLDNPFAKADVDTQELAKALQILIEVDCPISKIIIVD